MSVQPTSKHVLAGKRIVVAGAGLAGLAFARALDQQWPAEHPKPTIVLYERSAKELDVSREGYTMGIRQETGLLTLQRIGLLEQALESSTTKTAGHGQSLPVFWRRDWTPLLKLDDSPTEPDKYGMPGRHVRLLRYTLRQILMGGLPETATVNWRTGIDRAEPQASGKVKLTLSNGDVDECDLLVAADGANSSVRKCLLPDAKLDFAGPIVMMGTSRFPNGKPEPLRDSWGMNISGQGMPFLIFPVDKNTGVWATSYLASKPRDRMRGEEAVQHRDEITAEVKERGHMFAEPFGQFVDATDPQTLSIFSAMHKYPLEHAKDVPNANVVLIGDANHPMSPFSGNGANMALADSWSLAEQLVNNPGSIEDARRAFDAESRPRSTKAIDRSWWIIRVLHSKGWTFFLLSTVLRTLGFVLSFWKK